MVEKDLAAEGFTILPANSIDQEPRWLGIKKGDTYNAQTLNRRIGKELTQDGDDISGEGYYAQALYEFSDVAWKPTLSYRYAKFNDEFNGLAYGFTDWGFWFQGEIAGNYPLSNTNLESNMFRVKVTPHEKVTVNLFYYKFTFDNPQSFGVTSEDYGDEVDLMVDWQATDRVFVSAVLAQLNPDNAAETLAVPGVDGLFVGRSAWEVEGYLRLVDLAARSREQAPAEATQTPTGHDGVDRKS